MKSWTTLLAVVAAVCGIGTFVVAQVVFTAMQILRHSQIAVTMDIYSQVTSASTRDALAKLGGRLDQGRI